MAGAETAESAVDNIFTDDLEDFETLPWSWTYVIVCIFMPFLTGQVNVLLTPGYTLYFAEMGWPLTSAGAAFSAGFALRILVQQVVLRAGYWIAAPICMVHLAIAILAMIYSTSEWAVFAQLVAVWSLDPACAIEGIAFDSFGASEVQARQASSMVLSISTISVAVSCTIGGVVYDAAGWTGVTAYHCALEGLLVLSLCLQPACRKSFVEALFTRKDAAADQTETSGETVFVQVVPGQPQAAQVPPPQLPGQPQVDQLQQLPQLPGAAEELNLEEVEDEIGGNDSGMRRRQISFENDQNHRCPHLVPVPGATEELNLEEVKDEIGGNDSGMRRRISFENDQNHRSEPGQEANSSARITTISPPRTDSPHRGSHRCSTKSNHSARHRASERSARSSTHTRQSRRSDRTGQSVESVLSAITKLTALSQAGEDFRHHFGTNSSVLTQIVGATGEKSVPRLQIEDFEDEHRFAKGSVKAGMSAIPKDVKFPALLLMLCACCNNTAYSVEFATYAILFKKVHNWDEATLAGIAQTAGDLTAAVAMRVIPMIPALRQTEYSLHDDEAGCLRRFIYDLISEPYHLSFCLATWVIFHLGLCCPVLAVAIVAQVLMGTVYVFASKWVCDMNTFYSMGDSTVFLSLQVLCRSAEALGGAVAGGISIWLFTLDPLAPFLFAAALSGVGFLIYTVGFCSRLGFGDDIETVEQRRAVRKGVRRVSSWAVDIRKTQTDLE